jgi:hypothetical protein
MDWDKKEYDYAFWAGTSEINYVKELFKKAFDIYESKNYPEESDSLMCSIHNSFEEKGGHCCVGCNMEESSKQIINFLKNYSTFSTAIETFPTFILLLYLMVERIDEYLNMMELQKSIREKNFKVFSLIKQWANFIKHPKGFMLVHHPSYIYQGFKPSDEMLSYKNIENYDLTIDNAFVKEYYSGGDNNKKLYDKLTRKENVIVIFPNPAELIEDFYKAQIFFVNLICQNPIFQDLLMQKAMKYYEKEDIENE